MKFHWLALPMAVFGFAILEVICRIGSNAPGVRESWRQSWEPRLLPTDPSRRMAGGDFAFPRGRQSGFFQSKRPRPGHLRQGFCFSQGAAEAGLYLADRVSIRRACRPSSCGRSSAIPSSIRMIRSWTRDSTNSCPISCPTAESIRTPWRRTTRQSPSVRWRSARKLNTSRRLTRR